MAEIRRERSNPLGWSPIGLDCMHPGPVHVSVATRLEPITLQRELGEKTAEAIGGRGRRSKLPRENLFHLLSSSDG